MTSRLAPLVSAFVLIGGSAVAQPVADQAECQKRADRIASAAGVPSSPVGQGHFFVQKDEVAIVDGECRGPLSIRPDPEPFDVRPSPLYPNLVVRVAAAGFDLKPAMVRQAIDACLKVAIPDPPQHSGRAGFARQRWRDSQMTGSRLAYGLKWDCTYHGSETLAASVTVTKAE